MDQQELKTLLQQAPELAERTPFCPADRLIAQYFDATLSEKEHQRVQRHVTDCGYCQPRLGVLARLQEDNPCTWIDEDVLVTAKQLGGGSRSRKLRHAPVWTVAAVVVLALSVTTFRSTGQDQGSALPSQPPEAIEDGARQLRGIDQVSIQPQLLSPLAGALVDPGELVIRWTEIPGSLFYDLYIMSDAGDLLVNQRVNGSRWTVEQPGLFEAGAEYFVRLEAHMSDARTLSSEHVIFRVGGEE